MHRFAKPAVCHMASILPSISINMHTTYINSYNVFIMHLPYKKRRARLKKQAHRWFYKFFFNPYKQFQEKYHIWYGACFAQQTFFFQACFALKRTSSSYTKALACLARFLLQSSSCLSCSRAQGQVKSREIPPGVVHA